jgi:hypothetical protein
VTRKWIPRKPVHAIDHRLRAAAVSTLVIVTALSLTPASAQYAFNPASADEAPGIRYFGSAKDENGALLPAVSVLIDSEKQSYLFTTDEQGRYRVNVPLNLTPEKVTMKCFKSGFQLVRMNKRLGPSGPKVTVQVDCILKKSASSE